MTEKRLRNDNSGSIPYGRIISYIFFNMSQHLGVDLLKVNEGLQKFDNGLSFLSASEKVPQGLYGSKLSRKKMETMNEKKNRH